MYWNRTIKEGEEVEKEVQLNSAYGGHVKLDQIVDVNKIDKKIIITLIEDCHLKRLIDLIVNKLFPNLAPHLQ